jgi:PA domain
MLSGRSGSYTRFTELQHDVLATRLPLRSRVGYLQHIGFLGVLDTNYFESILAGLLPSYAANQLPIFVTDNVYLGTNGLIQNCCILGFHASQGPPIATAKTWIYAAYAQPGTFGGSQVGASFVDTVPLSHEIAEWLNDPFVGAFPGLNFIPPAVLPGQGRACIINFETGDPLEAPVVSFSKVTNGTTYHLQDEVTLPWYLHTTPSFSVNGWYTFQNLSAQIPLVINSPASIAGTYTNTATLDFAPVNTSVTDNVVYVGRGCPAGSISAGSPADSYLADPSGKIALIDRGACAISLKIDRAAQAGAASVLIGLVAPGDAISFSYGGGTHFVPSLVITQATSNLIKTALGSSAVNATISRGNALPVMFSSLCGPG